MKSSILVTREYPHPIAKVWKAITTPELLERWLMPNDFQPVVGHSFTFQTEPAPGFDGVIHCEVLEVSEPNRLRFTWKGGPVDTIASFRLTEIPEGTRLEFEQTGFVGVKAWLVSKMLKLGSRKIYGQRLPEVLDEMDSKKPLTPQPILDDNCGPFFKRIFASIVNLFPNRKGK